MDLCSGLNEILQVSSGEEVAQVHKLAVVGVLNVHNTPAVPAAPNRLAVNDNVILRADNSKWNDRLTVT